VPGIAEVADAAEPSWSAVHHARRIRRLALERQERRLLELAAQDPADADARDTLKRTQEELETLEHEGLDLGSLAFTGDRLRSLRERPQPESPLADLLDPMPCLAVAAGQPKVGKTTLALLLAQAWGAGVLPWDDAEALPGTRALVVSAEQPAARIDATMRRLDTTHADLTRDGWTERVVVVARDAELPAPLRRLLVLGDGGLAALRSGLLQAKRAGDPFGLVVLDSLSRLKPPDVEENDNDGMSRWLDALQRLAEDLGVWIVLIHHAGHADRDGAVGASRGASAIGAVAQVTWKLERAAATPRQRRLHVAGNAVRTTTLDFVVAPDDAPEGEIVYFRRLNVLDTYKLEDLLDVGESVATNAIAWRIEGREPKSKDDRPSSRAAGIAKRLREAWASDPRATVEREGRGWKITRTA
jgi:hypothetical protein